jgi:hypothetical protein
MLDVNLKLENLKERYDAGRFLRRRGREYLNIKGMKMCIGFRWLKNQPVVEFLRM